MDEFVDDSIKLLDQIYVTIGLEGEKRPVAVFPALVPLKRHTSEKVLVYFSVAKTTQGTHF